MRHYKTLFAVLLTIVALAFIVFVVVMQQNFNNPEFADLPEYQTASATKNQDEEEAESDDNGETKDEEEEEQIETTTSNRTVMVDSLNVRSGPGIDNEKTGVLVLNQIVEVEDSGEEWVKITTNDFTGYVNEAYLSEE